MRIVLLFFFAFQCHGQVSSLFNFDETYIGTSVMPFLELPVGARSAALGGNAVSILNDPSVALINPACMAGIAENGILFSHEEMYFGLRHEYAGWMHPTFRYGTFGAHLNLLSSGDIRYARDIDEKPVSSSTADMSLGAAYAKGLLDNRLLLGFNLQYLQSRLAKTTGRGFAGDVGVSGKFPYNIRSSIAVKNIGTDITYNTVAEPLPMGFLWDVGADFFNRKIAASAGVKKYSDSPLKIGAGVQGDIHPALCLRLGYEYAMQDNEQQEALKGLSAGFGISYGIFRADYAYTRRGEFLQGVHAFNAGFIFGRLTPLTDMDYYNQAQSLFKQARYEKSIKAAQEALKVNPNLWQAHMLIERSG